MTMMMTTNPNNRTLFIQTNQSRAFLGMLQVVAFGQDQQLVKVLNPWLGLYDNRPHVSPWA
jgi:hypothetical protein